MYGRRDAKNTQRSTGQPQGLLSQRYNPQGPPSRTLGGTEAQAGWGTDNQGDTSVTRPLGGTDLGQAGQWLEGYVEKSWQSRVTFVMDPCALPRAE